MKNILSVITVSILIAACGSDPMGDKQQQLDSLIKEQSLINEKIKTLKDEIRKETGDQSGIKLVSIENPTKTSFQHFVEVQARVDGDESVNVSARSQGTVTAIVVNEGDSVLKGQVLATLDDQFIRQTLSEVQTQYNFAKDLFNKQKNLWDQKIGSEVQFLTAKNNKESLEKRLATVKEQLDLTRIKSPVNGTIENIAIKIGQAIAPGMSAFSVVNLTRLKVKGEVGESYAAKINEGDEVILFFPDLNKEIRSKVSFSSKMINTLNRTFNVEVPLSGEAGSFSPNMIAVMKIVDYKNDSVIVLPIDMLQRSADGFYLMTAIEKKGKLLATRIPVERGLIYNGKVEILSGLSESDQIISNGYRDLNEGQEIRTK